MLSPTWDALPRLEYNIIHTFYSEGLSKISILGSVKYTHVHALWRLEKWSVPQGIAGDKWTEKWVDSLSGEAFSEFTVTWSLCFPGGRVVKNSPANAADSGDLSLIPGLGRSPEGGNGNPLQYSSLENPTHKETWQTKVHGTLKSQTWQSAHTRSLSNLRVLTPCLLCSAACDARLLMEDVTTQSQTSAKPSGGANLSSPKSPVIFHEYLAGYLSKKQGNNCALSASSTLAPPLQQNRMEINSLSIFWAGYKVWSLSLLPSEMYR